MTEDRYLDSSRVIREINEAERKFQLDEQAALDELAKACTHCDKQQRYHSENANAYMLARVAYFAEARRRTALTLQEAGLRGMSKRLGRPDPVTKEGFKKFAERMGISLAYAQRLCAIGASEDPTAALLKHRKKVREQTKGHRLVSHSGQPLVVAKEAWGAMTQAEKHEFLAWVLEQPRAQAKTINKTEELHA